MDTARRHSHPEDEGAMDTKTCFAMAAAVGLLALQSGCASQAGGNTQLYRTEVYVVGSVSNGTVSVATCWHDGQATALSDGTESALAEGIALAGTDVYVAGGVNQGGLDVATYWKNGVPVALTDGSNEAFAVGITVSGADVYVTGYEDDPQHYGVARAKVWKNGVATVLTDGDGMAQANAVQVDAAGNVEVVGWEYQTHQINSNTFYTTAQAVYWHNGAATTLTGFADGGGAFAICLSGSDVYICGNEFNVGVNPDNGVAMVWKNGAGTALTDGSAGAELTGLGLKGGTVVAAGIENDVQGQAKAMVWNGSVPTNLLPGVLSVVNGLALGPLTGGVFLAGTVQQSSGAEIATLWQNGTQVNLTDGKDHAQAQAIAVVETLNL